MSLRNVANISRNANIKPLSNRSDKILIQAMNIKEEPQQMTSLDSESQYSAPVMQPMINLKKPGQKFEKDGKPIFMSAQERLVGMIAKKQSVLNLDLQKPLNGLVLNNHNA